MTQRILRKKTLVLAVSALLLVAAPLAVAGPGGNAPEHADDRAGKGMAKSAEARAAAANHADENETEDLDVDGNETDEGVGKALGHAKRADAANGTERAHPGKHAGFAKAMAHVPDAVKAFFQAILDGMHPSQAAKLARME